MPQLNAADLGLLHLLSDWMADPQFRAWLLDTSTKERRKVLDDYRIDAGRRAWLTAEDLGPLRWLLAELLADIDRGELHAPPAWDGERHLDKHSGHIVPAGNAPSWGGPAWDGLASLSPTDAQAGVLTTFTIVGWGIRAGDELAFVGEDQTLAAKVSVTHVIKGDYDQVTVTGTATLPAGTYSLGFRPPAPRLPDELPNALTVV